MEQASHTDGELLAAFVDGGQEAPFEELVRRHGRMVFNVCLRILGGAHAAEDAAQAVFLTLSHKAGSLRGRASAAGWLYHVAWHVARRAREAEALRKEREREAGAMAAQSNESVRAWAQLKPVLDDELNALPERFRLPVVLHHLEGYSEEEGAKLLGWNRGTFSSRISRGRELLRERVARRGVVLSAGMLATVVSGHAAAAEVPAAFAATMSKAATLVAAGNAAVSGLVPTQAAALTQGALKMLFVAKLKVAAITLAIAGLCSGAGITGYRVMAGENAEGREPLKLPQSEQAASPAGAKEAKASADGIKDGFSVTVTPSKAQFEPAEAPSFTLCFENKTTSSIALTQSDHHNVFRAGNITLTDLGAGRIFPLQCMAKTELSYTQVLLEAGNTHSASIELSGNWCLAHNSNSTMQTLAAGRYRLEMELPFETDPAPPGQLKATRTMDNVKVGADFEVTGTRPNATAKFFGSEDQWPKCGIALRDIHPLWGGMDVDLQGNGVCSLRNVDRRHETKTSTLLALGETQAFRTLCIQNDLAGLKIPERPGVPDEARPRIVLKNASGKTFEIAKWANDKVPAFDRVYKALLLLKDMPAAKEDREKEEKKDRQ